MNQVINERPANTGITTVVYVLYLVTLISGITAIVGVIMAYMYRDEAPDWLRTHYEMQIRTFWIGVLDSIIAGILCTILIGFVLFFVIAIWWIVRCVKGIALGLALMDQANEKLANAFAWLIVLSVTIVYFPKIVKGTGLAK